MPLHWNIDDCASYGGRLRLRGWCHHSTRPIASLAAVFEGESVDRPLHTFGQPSPDVAAAIDRAATHCRFDEWIEHPPEVATGAFTLRVTFADGTALSSEPWRAKVSPEDPFHRCWSRFLTLLQALPAGTVLEIGSRARSAITRRAVVPGHLDYVGLDILAGPNVDVVGDAHALEEIFGRGRFVAAFSFSVLEHIAMPWKLAVELNRVLAPGGIVFTQTHQTWPMHEAPWDFWRFSPFSWKTLFNAATGFDVVEAACGEPARIHACRPNAITLLLPDEPAFLGSASIVRKISETELSWPVPTHIAAPEMYPAGILTTPPA